MSTTAIALLAYIVLMIILALMIVVQRSLLVVSGKRAANSFASTGEDVSAFSQRVCRAHANTYEHFPIVAGLWLFALATGQTAVTDPLALLVLAARWAQAGVHVVSTSEMAVMLRAALLAVQLGIAVWWILAFLGA